MRINTNPVIVIDRTAGTRWRKLKRNASAIVEHFIAAGLLFAIFLSVVLGLVVITRGFWHAFGGDLP